MISYVWFVVAFRYVVGVAMQRLVSEIVLRCRPCFESVV